MIACLGADTVKRKGNKLCSENVFFFLVAMIERNIMWSHFEIVKFKVLFLCHFEIIYFSHSHPLISSFFLF